MNPNIRVMRWLRWHSPPPLPPTNACTPIVCIFSLVCKNILCLYVCVTCTCLRYIGIYHGVVDIPARRVCVEICASHRTCTEKNQSARLFCYERENIHHPHRKRPETPHCPLCNIVAPQREWLKSAPSMMGCSAQCLFGGRTTTPPPSPHPTLRDDIADDTPYINILITANIHTI